MTTNPLTLNFEVAPSVLPDEVSTKLLYRMPKDSKFAKAVAKVLGCGDSPSTDGEITLPFRWVKLMVAAAGHFDLAAIGDRVPMFSPYDPSWVASLFALIEVDGVFDAPFDSAAKILSALQGWKTRSLEGGNCSGSIGYSHSYRFRLTRCAVLVPVWCVLGVPF